MAGSIAAAATSAAGVDTNLDLERGTSATTTGNSVTSNGAHRRGNSDGDDDDDDEVQSIDDVADDYQLSPHHRHAEQDITAPTETPTTPSRPGLPEHQRSRSTTFAPMQAPLYKTAPDAEKEGGLKPTRTFSRREQGEHADRPDHPFGGQLSRRDTENHLERFMSQKGQDRIIVHWEGDHDSENPMTWSRTYRWYLTALAGLLVLNSTFTSSAPSGIAPATAAELGYSSEVATLTLAIFVAGYCLGPLIWGPLSERVGRKPVFIVALAIYTCFNLGCALSQNTASILVFRFLSGTFAAAPLTNSGGVLADCWEAETRGIAMGIFSVAPFAGPALGPIVAGFIYVSGTSWRWLYGTCTIFSFVCLVLVIFTLPETYHPVLLRRKAQRLRKELNDDRYVAPLELHKLKATELLSNILLKPFRMLIEEPALLSITLYMSFIYGVVYLLFEAYPVVFSEGHGFNAGISGLMFLPFFGGGVISVILYVVYFNPRYVRKMHASKDGRAPPEERMIITMVASPSLVIALFWFAWTSYPSISFVSPMLAGSLLGFGICYVFLGLFNYIVDAYLANAASALAANTICRSAAGAGFPLFASQMYTKLNPRWASTLLGCLALVMAPIPFVLYKYGPAIRRMSKHAHG